MPITRLPRIIEEYQQDVDRILSVDNNFYPIYHIPLGRVTGLDIRGKFTTNDAGTPGSISYVTVGRQSTSTFVAEGLGFGWKISKAIQTSTDGGVTLIDNVDFNCYIVDNSSLSSDTFISMNNLITDNGINNYIGGNNTLTYGKRRIVKDTTYSFRMVITNNLQITIWIFPDGQDLDLAIDSFAAPDTTGEPTVPYGWAVKKSSSDPAYMPNASGPNFGISVMGTGGYEWRYSNLLIKTISNDFVGNLYKLDAPVTYFGDGNPLNIYWKGWGEWTDSEDFPQNGVKLFIYNIDTTSWELVGSNTGDQLSPLSARTITSQLDDIAPYRDGNSFVNLLAVADYPDVTATVNTEYVALDNITTSGIHVGGMVDIYVNSPTRIVQAVTTVTVGDDGRVLINSNNGFILPVQEITGVVTVATGTELTKGVDYTIYVSEPKNAFSTEPSSILIFSGDWTPSYLYVSYRYYSDGLAIKSFIESDTHRNPAVSPLLKIKPPLIITIKSLDYRGTASEEKVKEVIVEWVNGLETSLEVSDLIDLLYNNEVDYIRLTTLDIVYRSYNEQGELLYEDESISDSISLVELQAFYTDSSELYGISKIG